MTEKTLGCPKGRRFSLGEKLRIIEEARSPNTTMAKVLRRYQVDGATFYNWEKQAKAAATEAMQEALARSSGGRARGGGGASAADRAKDERIARLEAELEKKTRVIAEVVEENLALKKGV
jgi:transposase-like protein